jgi:hypothetical protein
MLGGGLVGREEGWIFGLSISCDLIVSAIPSYSILYLPSGWFSRFTEEKGDVWGSGVCSILLLLSLLVFLKVGRR